jgi:HlyD family secretion protein
MMDWICSLAVIGPMIGACAEPTLAVGYVEGEYVALAQLETARIESVAVRLGDRVAPGAVIAAMEKSDSELVVADAAARLAQAES